MARQVILKKPLRCNGGRCSIGSRVTVPDRYADLLVRLGHAVESKAKSKPKKKAKKKAAPAEPSNAN